MPEPDAKAALQAPSIVSESCTSTQLMKLASYAHRPLSEQLSTYLYGAEDGWKGTLHPGLQACVWHVAQILQAAQQLLQGVIAPFLLCPSLQHLLGYIECGMYELRILQTGPCAQWIRLGGTDEQAC